MFWGIPLGVSCDGWVFLITAITTAAMTTTTKRKIRPAEFKTRLRGGGSSLCSMPALVSGTDALIQRPRTGRVGADNPPFWLAPFLRGRTRSVRLTEEESKCRPKRRQTPREQGPGCSPSAWVS